MSRVVGEDNLKVSQIVAFAYMFTASRTHDVYFPRILEDLESTTRCFVFLCCPRHAFDCSRSCRYREGRLEP